MHIKYLLFFSIFSIFAFGQKGEMLYTNKIQSEFLFLNFKDNSFCYEGYNFISGRKFISSGSLQVSKDTIRIRSAFDVMNLQMNVKSDSESSINTHRFIFNLKMNQQNKIDSALYQTIRKHSLYAIVNNADTIQIDQDTIIYNKPVVNFYIVSFNVEHFCYDTHNIYNIYTVLNRTVAFENKTKCNVFNVSFDINPKFIIYKTIDVTIILKKSKAYLYLNDELINFSLKRIKKKKNKKYFSYC